MRSAARLYVSSGTARVASAPTRCMATSGKGKPSASASKELKVSKPRPKPSKERVPTPTRAFDKRRRQSKAALSPEEETKIKNLGEEHINEDREADEWRRGLRDFNPSFRGLKFNKKTFPVGSDTEADSWMKQFMRLDVPDKIIPPEAFAAREEFSKRPIGGALPTMKDLSTYAPTPEERAMEENKREITPLGDTGPAGKLLRMNAELEDWEGRTFWNNIEIPAEYVKYFEEPDNPRSMPQRIQRYVAKMKRIEEWKKQHPKEKKASSWKADTEDAPYTRRQLAVTEKLQEILERVLTEWTGTEWPMSLRKADFTIVEAIVSKDMRRLQVIWDCKIRKEEIADLIKRDAGKLRKVVTARAKMKWSPELRFTHFDDSEVAEIEAEEARQKSAVDMLEKEMQLLPEAERDAAEDRQPDPRKHMRRVKRDADTG